MQNNQVLHFSSAVFLVTFLDSEAQMKLCMQVHMKNRSLLDYL